MKQKQKIFAQLNKKKHSKQTQYLEQTLNDFFYNKSGSNYEKYYNKAIDVATTAFNERYKSYPFELDMEKLTARFSNKNIKFLSKNTVTLDKAKALAEEIEKYMQQVGLNRESWKMIIAHIKNLQSLSSWKDVRDLNGIVASIIFGNKTAYGDAFEYPLAAFSAVMEQGIDTSVDDIIEKGLKKSLQGGERSKSYLDISHLSKSDRKKLNIKNSVIVNDNIRLEYANPTQNKIDVNLILQGQEFNISAKSYSNVYKDIHILGGAPLTVPVLNLSTVDFVSHYLTSLYIDDNNLSQIHEAIRLNILFTALSGAGSSPVEADTFVLNDKKNKKIYVRNMSDIVQNIANTTQWKYININEQGATIPDDALHNFQLRKSANNVVDMINLMHTIKLQVSLKGSAIRDSLKTSD